MLQRKKVEAASQGSSRGLCLDRFDGLEGMCLWMQNVIISSGSNRKMEVLIRVGCSSNAMNLRGGNLGPKFRTNRIMLYGLESVPDLPVPWSSHHPHKKTEYLH